MKSSEKYSHSGVRLFVVKLYAVQSEDIFIVVLIFSTTDMSTCIYACKVVSFAAGHKLSLLINVSLSEIPQDLM